MNIFKDNTEVVYFYDETEVDNGWGAPEKKAEVSVEALITKPSESFVSGFDAENVRDKTKVLFLSRSAWKAVDGLSFFIQNGDVYQVESVRLNIPTQYHARVEGVLKNG